MLPNRLQLEAVEYKQELELLGTAAIPKDKKSMAKFADNMATANEIRDKFASTQKVMRFLEELVNLLESTSFHADFEL